jgi:hypothetical protein
MVNKYWHWLKYSLLKLTVFDPLRHYYPYLPAAEHIHEEYACAECGIKATRFHSLTLTKLCDECALKDIDWF